MFHDLMIIIVCGLAFGFALALGTLIFTLKPKSDSNRKAQTQAMKDWDGDMSVVKEMRGKVNAGKPKSIRQIFAEHGIEV